MYILNAAILCAVAKDLEESRKEDIVGSERAAPYKIYFCHVINSKIVSVVE